ncbi:MAG: hypothetical protein PHD88_07235 [Firmicutes bacterium]|nr:hypothetical protein [Bacillota bacterium]MDD4264079.1 hypothetical protein [Bacillota bacterium]MDD4694175.1 hypothetical protein [Bacillota bacterium]
MIIFLLVLSLIAPSSLAKPQKIGYVYSLDATGVPRALILEEKSNIEGKELFDYGVVIEAVGAGSSIDSNTNKSLESFMGKFMKGKGAFTLGSLDKGLYLDVNNKAKGNSVVWKYLNPNDVGAAFGFCNIEIIVLEGGWPNTMISLLKQNEEVYETKSPDHSSVLSDFRIEVYQTATEEIVVCKVKDESETIVRVVRDDKETTAFSDFLLDCLSELDAAYQDSDFDR